jgi:hypothetical protein
MMRLSLAHGQPYALFSDMSEDPCILTQSYHGNRGQTHRLLLGQHRHAMLLSQADVRALLPHLLWYAATGSLMRDPVLDYSI